MKEYKIKKTVTCKSCPSVGDDACDFCEHNHDNNYHNSDEIVYTMTYGDLLDIPKSELDDVMKDVLRVLGVAERVGRMEADYGEYLLAIENTAFNMIDGAEFLDNGGFRFLGIEEVPAAFAGLSNRRNFRFFVQDSAMTGALNQYELDAQFGLIECGIMPDELFSKHWHIWHADDVADNLVDESRRMSKVYDFYGGNQGDDFVARLFDAFVVSCEKSN